MLLEGEPGASDRRLLLDVTPGTHVLHYDVADPVRYYAEIDVQRGENHLKPEFFESRLPSLYRYIGLGDERVEASREADYVIYDADNRRVDRHAMISIAVDVTSGADGPGTALARLSWSLTLDGEEIADETRSFVHPVDEPDPHVEDVAIYSDDAHRYWAHVRLARDYAHLELNAAFNP